MKIMSPAQFNKYPQETQEDIAKLANALKGCKPYEFKRAVATIFEKTYNLGMASAMEGEVVEQGRCVVIEKGKKFYINCPKCNELIELDMESLLPNAEGYAVKV